MARAANTPSGPVPFTSIKRDPLLELDRLLARLSQNILHATAEQERRLRRDEFERTKVRHDISAARSLLTQTEQSALGIKIHKRRAETQSDLVQKRELIETLLERVQVLEDLGRQEVGAESEDEDGEDLLEGIVMPTAAHVEESRATNGNTEGAVPSKDASSGPERTPAKSVSWDVPPPSEPAQEKASTTTTPALRARGRKRAPSTNSQPPQPNSDTAQTTSSQASSSTDQRAHLFGQRNDLSADATEAAVKEYHEAEHEVLEKAILDNVRQLKLQTEATSKMLDDDKSVMDRVGEALNSTDTNMESAGRNMNMLARMTEGKGFIGRLILLGIIYGLLILLIVAFATLPKLRWK